MSLVMRPEQVASTLRRLAHQIDENLPSGSSLLLLGVPSRGNHLARRLAEHLEAISDRKVLVGVLDIGAHRDDDRRVAGKGLTHIPGVVDGMRVVIVDDVIYTGRTIRAALDALVDHGRPAQVQVAALVDRGHREVPIKPDFVGKNLPTSREERVFVKLQEVDETEGVFVEGLVAT